MSETEIALSLAQWVQGIRETLGYSQSKLAEKAHLPLTLIEEIEGGLQLFMAPAQRQRLARALKVRPVEIQQVEKKWQANQPSKTLSPQATEQWLDEMIHFPTATYHCPQCQNPLVVRLFHRRDLDDNPLVDVKAHCTSCLFRLTSG